MTTVLPIIAIMISVVSLSWAIFVTLRKGDVSRPVLKFVLGYTGPATKVGGEKILPHERKDLSTVIFVGKLEDGETGVFPLHFGLQNGSNIAAKNIQIILSYPQQFCIKDFSFIEHLDFADKSTRKLQPAVNERSVSTIGRNAHVVYEYGLCRPGAGTVSFEPITFHFSKSNTPDLQQVIENLPLENRMHHSGVAGYFALDVFVTAENCRPTTKRFNVLWLNERIEEQKLPGILERIAHGFCGKFPKLGLFGKPPWEKPPFKWEAAEILQLDLTAATHAKRKFKIAEVEPLGLALAKISMPTWNYHEEERPAHLNRYFS